MSTRARRFVAAVTNVALAVAISACAPKTSQPSTRVDNPSDARRNAARGRPSAEEELRRDLQSIFTGSAVDHAFWSVSVRSLKQNESLFSLNPSRMQTPASNQKLITTAVAAEKLGWDYRYTTKIYATGPLSPGGDLDGDLVIVSNGDPTINRRHPDRVGTFDAWAKQLYEKGVRRVGGQLIGDDNA
ncbi:MAG TPA: D-alanyl-D-alanine carboxypeptidase, partial [Vicinamibacterales bacterium]